MVTTADFCIFRTGLRMLLLVTALATGSALYAQPEMGLTHTGNAIADGDTYDFTPIKGATLPMGFVIANSGTTDLNITNPVMLSGASNCSVSMQSNPASTITAGNSDSMAITLSTPDSGPYSFTVTIINNDADENPYTFTVSGTVPGGGGGGSGDGGSGGGCSTGEGSGWLIVLALVAEIIFCARIGMFSFRD
jgi:hypothetical protein